MEQYTGQFKDIELNTYISKKSPVCDDIICFDIETTSAWVLNGNVIPYTSELLEKQYNELQAVSLCYICQISFNGNVYYVRELTDMLKVFEDLNSRNCNMIIWVHNLSFEMQFLNNILIPYKEVFARTARKPMKFISERFPNLEFRCSYMLTRLALDSWGKQLGFEKLHTLDYTQIRTPLTKLSDMELDYCERDCLVMYKGLQIYRDRYQHLKNIPLTQTGEVRKELKHRVFQNKLYQKFMTKLLPHDISEYRLLLQAFIGGYVHSNFLRTGYLIKQKFKSYDFSSSYPYVLVAYKYPMTPFNYKAFNWYDVDDYFYILHIKIKNVKPKLSNHFWSKSKVVNGSNMVVDNGRIMSADELELVITSVDLSTFNLSYSYTDMEVVNSLASKMGYLPTPFVQYVLDLYVLKTTLKGVKGREDEYMHYKQMLNSLYGMCVTALIPDGVIFDGFEWSLDIKTVSQIEDYLNELREKPKGRAFTSFAWGVAVTAYAKNNLWRCMCKDDKGVNCSDDTMYSDTDSLKILGSHTFNWYNAECDKRLKDACKYHGIDFEMTRPVDIKGISHPLGYFEFEEENSGNEFKTLGAKRYCYRSNDGSIHLTCSGVNKGASKSLKSVDDFSNHLKFNKDDPNLTLKYLIYIDHDDKMLGVTFNKGRYDEYTNTKYIWGIAMRDRGYDLTIDSDYEDLIYSDVHYNRNL